MGGSMVDIGFNQIAGGIIVLMVLLTVLLLVFGFLFVINIANSAGKDVSLNETGAYALLSFAAITTFWFFVGYRLAYCPSPAALAAMNPEKK